MNRSDLTQTSQHFSAQRGAEPTADGEAERKILKDPLFCPQPHQGDLVAAMKSAAVMEKALLGKK